MKLCMVYYLFVKMSKIQRKYYHLFLGPLMIYNVGWHPQSCPQWFQCEFVTDNVPTIFTLINLVKVIIMTKIRHNLRQP